MKRRRPCLHHGELKNHDIGFRKFIYKGESRDYTYCLICYRQRNILRSEANDKNRTCITCRKLLSDDKYTKNELNKKWRTCRTCKKEYQQKRKEYSKNARLIAEYGITIDEYNLMLKKQKGLCAICGNIETKTHHKNNLIMELSVDHCHETKKVRALLCSKCNLILGNAMDDINILIKSIKYLKKHLKEELIDEQT